MIAYIKGICLAQEEGRVVLDLHGLGYEVLTGKPAQPGMVGQEMAYYTYLHVREDGFELYGFASLQEKALFLALTSVSGIGPKSAMAIVTADDPRKLAQEIVRGNEAYLVTLPGVGKKTAGRMVLELKDKLATNLDWAPSAVDSQALEGGPGSAAAGVIEALVSLGYQDQEIRAVQKEVFDAYPEDEEDVLLRKALRHLRRG